VLRPLPKGILPTHTLQVQSATVDQATANQHLVIAAYAQALLLFASAILVLLYVRSTIQIERAAVRQSQIAAAQLEALARPVLVLEGDANTLALVNTGNGPALEVAWWWWPEANENPPWPDAPVDRATYIAQQQNQLLRWRTPAELTQGREVVFCRYRSISGTGYISIGRRLGSEGTGGYWYTTEIRKQSEENQPTSSCQSSRAGRDRGRDRGRPAGRTG
jgi:hypothetical protein